MLKMFERDMKQILKNDLYVSLVSFEESVPVAFR